MGSRSPWKAVLTSENPPGASEDRPRADVTLRTDTGRGQPVAPAAAPRPTCLMYMAPGC